MNPDDTGKGMFSEGEDNTVGAYVTRFTLNPELRDKRVVVQFDGVEQAMYLWLNGQFVGYAEDSFSQSEFDLTPYLQDGENLMAVEVFKRSTAAFIEDQDFFRFSGIFRSVRLVGQPAIHVADMTIRGEVAPELTNAKLNLTLQLQREKNAAGTAEIEVRDAAGKVVMTSTQSVSDTLKISEDFDQVHLWQHVDPYLYSLKVTLLDSNGDVLEVVPYDFGFRRFELKDKVMLLNGKRLVINGVNRHEWNAKTGRAITDADMVADLATFKANNINAVRTCHYPDQIDWYYMCDHAGIYMMAENNLESHGTWQKNGRR